MPYRSNHFGRRSIGMRPYRGRSHSSVRPVRPVRQFGSSAVRLAGRGGGLHTIRLRMVSFLDLPCPIAHL